MATETRARKFFAGLVFLVLGAGGEAAELKKFTLGYSTVGPAGTGLWMAKEVGAFGKYGPDAELIFISAGPLVVQALLGGDLQAGLAATNAVTAAVMVGATVSTAIGFLPTMGASASASNRGSSPKT